MRVLIVEDELKMAGLLRRGLVEEGHAADVATTGEDAVWMAQSHPYEAIVLDVMLPGLSGFETCRQLRNLGVWAPVLMLTARDGVDDRVAGLDVGADDYLTKPFGNHELLARVQALLRRSRNPKPAHEVYDDGRLQVRFAEREVLADGKPAVLTPTEFRLLAALVQHSGQVLSTQQLLEQAWNDPLAIGPDRVKFSILRLRQKLGWRGPGGPIEAVRGFGYRYRYRTRSADATLPNILATDFRIHLPSRLFRAGCARLDAGFFSYGA